MDDDEIWFKAYRTLDDHHLDFSTHHVGFVVRAPGWPLGLLTPQEVLDRFVAHGLEQK